MQYILNILNSIPGDAWSVIIDVLVSAVIVSPLALGVKKWLSVDNEKKMLILVVVGSMLASAGAYLQSVPKFAPWFVLVQGWLVFATTQPVYFLFVKPLSKRLGVWFTEQIAKVALANEAKAAAVPAEGLPLTSTPSPVEDFSH